jgi:hypothetical protein
MNKGLKNTFIDNILKNKIPNFKGVNILKSKFNNQAFSTVINVEGHFVAIISNKKYIYYYDPIGLPPMDSQILTFLKNDRRSLIVNKVAHQHPLSIYCGFYVMNFVMSVYYKKPIPSFSKNNLWKNDRIVVDRLVNLLNKCNT